MPADRSALRLKSFLAILAALALTLGAAGCGGSDNEGTSANLEKPALTIPEGSVSAKKSSSTDATGSTGSSSDDSSSSSSGSGTSTGGTNTGGTDNGAADGGAGQGGDTGGADNTGGAAPGQ